MSGLRIRGVDEPVGVLNRQVEPVSKPKYASRPALAIWDRVQAPVGGVIAGGSFGGTLRDGVQLGRITP